MSTSVNNTAFRITADDRAGVLHAITGVLANLSANITSIEIVHRQDGRTRVHLEYRANDPAETVAASLLECDGVQKVEPTTPAGAIYGKRIIVIGGGAQVGQVAMGAASEADRHNIRGERISVDTIPLVGEQALATAVRSVVALPRARLLVLAGSLMGGEITRAVREVRDRGMLVISLNMAGSVPSAADLVVTDPVQAGVMAVMAIADTAQFDLHQQQKNVF